MKSRITQGGHHFPDELSNFQVLKMVFSDCFGLEAFLLSFYFGKKAYAAGPLSQVLKIVVEPYA